MMDALEALQSRSSFPRLSEPAPGEAELANIYRAALRAADHALLRPWRFLCIRGASRERLGDLFVAAARAGDPTLSDTQAERIRQKPLRAPLIIVTIASPGEHPKVPVFEQDLSAAAATQNMLVAAYAQGVGAMWRTGAMAYDPVVKQGLGLAGHEKIIAFLYLGTAMDSTRRLVDADPADFFQEW
ncbi:MAG: nitroreductase [Pseudohongiellaceae bacterium]